MSDLIKLFTDVTLWNDELMCLMKLKLLPSLIFPGYICPFALTGYDSVFYEVKLLQLRVSLTAYSVAHSMTG